MDMTTKMKAGAAAVAGSAVLASSASALTSTLTVALEFFDPFSLVITVAADFGRLISGVATTYQLDVANAVAPGIGGSETGPTANSVAGQYTLADSASGGNVDVTVDNPVANGGVTITGFDCDWNAAANTDNGATCAFTNVTNPAAAGDILIVGFDITVDGTQASGATATPSFDVTLAYN